jgi:hypothetical protein
MRGAVDASQPPENHSVHIISEGSITSIASSRSSITSSASSNYSIYRVGTNVNMHERYGCHALENV